MDEIRVRRKQITDPIIFGTGEAQLIVVERRCLHVLDVEDSHFAHDRSILMPDIRRVDGSEPTLDERRITGLGVIYAALVHHESHPEQKVFVAGHADKSGSALYNLELSKKRADNVQLFLGGKRDQWRTQSDEESHHDDVRRILAFQATRALWDCHPDKHYDAVERFQLRYNEEVDSTASKGLDLPYKETIGVDNDAGPETWGAFFDIYAHEVMRLLGIEEFSELERRFARMKGFADLPPSVGCGENIPFESGRREAFEPDEDRGRPEHNPPDRRVEIMFFDEDEKPDLACHVGSICNPEVCPIYTTETYRHREIGIPRGLQIGEVLMQLRFEDPQGNTHPLPAGIEVEVRFDDGSSRTHVLTDDAVVNFVAARDKSSFDLALTTEDGECLCFMDGAAELVDRDEAIDKVDEGARFFRLPDAFDTHDADWRVPADVAFADGRFVGLDNPATRIGKRGRPAEVVLVPRWQHFRFEFFDRWSGGRATVPQTRPRQPDTHALLLEGHLGHGDYDNGPTDPPVTESIWDIEVGGQTVHCLAWVQRRPPVAGSDEPAAEEDGGEVPAPPEEPRELPDGATLTRFVLPERTFVRTDGEPGADKPARIVETIGDGHEHFEDVSRACAARLRYYDLPVEWWSKGYSARVGSGERQSFTKITEPSTAGRPYVIDLDDIVLAEDDEDRGLKSGFYNFGDEDKHRFAIRDHRLATYKPMANDPYFTDFNQLSPKPGRSTIFDYPPFTRLITRGFLVFDVFDARTPVTTGFRFDPIGARMAVARETSFDGPFFSYDPSYQAPVPDDLGATRKIGGAALLVLRCCGVDGATEVFHVAHYAVAHFEFNPKNPKRGQPITPAVAPDKALASTQKCLVEVARRWNGADSTNPHPAYFEVGPADDVTARGQHHALLARMANSNDIHYLINIVDEARANMAPLCYWDQDNLEDGDDGSFVAAHEWGHAFGHPDHYPERGHNASLHAPGISDENRSPGCPYSHDPNGMMNGAEKRPRGYDLWQVALWLAEPDRSFAGATHVAVRHGKYRYETEVTPRAQSRALHPVIARLNCPVGPRGLCDIFAYCGGVDGFNGGDGLPGATVEQPWDLVVSVRVKMAFTLQETELRRYDDGRIFMRELADILDRVFNKRRRVLARGTFEGRPVRARIMFSPRFIVRTFPTGSSTERARYLQQLELTAATAAGYTAKVQGLVAGHGIHCEVTAVDDPDDDGVVDGTSTPRVANLDTDDVEDGIVEIFASLIGLLDPEEDDAPEQYGPVVDLLAPAFVRSSLEFVE